VPGAEQAVAVERLAPSVGHDPARLAQAQPRGGEVVGRVVEDLAAADPLELRADSRHVVDQPRPDLDHRVELTRHDPGHHERLRSEFERAAADRGGVDQVAEHLDRRPDGPPPEPVRPEHPAHVGRGAERDRPGRLHAGATLRQEPVTRLDLDHAPDLDVVHRRLAVSERCERHRHARGLEPRHRRPGAVDRVDYQHVDRVRRRDQAAVLGVVRDARRALRQELLQLRLRERVDGERHISAGTLSLVRTPGVRAQLGEHPLAQPLGEVEHELSAVVHRGI
jgi:hypothetical protein